MTKRLFTAITVATLLAAPTAHGADKKGTYAIRGAGLLTCQNFVTERAKKSPAYMMIGGWLDGYITASDKLQPDTYDVGPYVSTELLSVLINRHCSSNPDDRLAPVVDGLLARLNDDRLTTSSPLIEVEVGEYKTSLYAQIIKNIQVKLTQEGMFKGTANGLWSDETSAALTRYQKNIKFEATGFPDQKTLWYLFRSKK